MSGFRRLGQGKKSRARARIRIRRVAVVATLALAVSIAMSGAASAETTPAETGTYPRAVSLENGDFDQPQVTDPSGRQTVSEVPGWTVHGFGDQQPCATVHGEASGDAVPAGSQLLGPCAEGELTGYFDITTPLPTLPNHAYRLDVKTVGLAVRVNLTDDRGDLVDTYGPNTAADGITSYTFDTGRSTPSLNLMTWWWSPTEAFDSPRGVEEVSLVDLGRTSYIRDLGPEAPPAGDLVVNGGFEQTTPGRLQRPTPVGWTAPAQCSEEPFGAEANQGYLPYRGAWTARVGRQSGRADCTHGLRQEVSTVPGHEYALTYAYMSRVPYISSTPNTPQAAWSADVLTDGAVVGQATVPTRPYEGGKEGQSSWSTNTVNVVARDDVLALEFLPNVGYLSIDSVSLVDVTKDRMAPVVTVPDTRQVEATGPGGAAVSYTAAATDELDPSPTLECTPSSGQVFPLGRTTVTCTASDASGNTGSASWDVLVTDTTAPRISAPTQITVNAEGRSGGPATWTATATDLVDGMVPVECASASGTSFPVGTTTITCRAKDTAGNTATHSLRVTVLGAQEQAARLLATLEEIDGLRGQLPTVRALMASLASGRYAAAAGQLQSLVNSTTALLRSGRLSQDEVRTVTTAVADILRALR